MAESIDLKYEPCPLIQIGKCNGGKLMPVPGYKDMWKCDKCGSEVYVGDIPSWKDYQMFKDANNTKKLMLPGDGPIQFKGGGNKSGKRRKKKKAFKPNYRFDVKPKAR